MSNTATPINRTARAVPRRFECSAHVAQVSKQDHLSTTRAFLALESQALQCMSCGDSHCSGTVLLGLPVASAEVVFRQTLDMIAPYRPGLVSAAHGTLCPLQRTLCLSTQQPNRAERFRKRDAVFGFVSRRLKKVQRFFDSNVVGYRANSLQPTASDAAGQLHKTLLLTLRRCTAT